MTKIYGCSDDNVELEGDIEEEIGCYNKIVTLFFSDGTAARFQYPKFPNLGVWGCTVINKGYGGRGMIFVAGLFVGACFGAVVMAVFVGGRQG